METHFIVPPFMKDGDHLTPFQFTMFPWQTQFYLFGRYQERTDMIQCVIAGPPGHKYKVSFSDGNSPYGWKIKRHGVTRQTMEDLNWADEVIGRFLYMFLTMVGKEPSKSFMREIIKADAFVLEDVIGIPMAMLRLSHKSGVMDAKAQCIGAWSFFGPSLPEAFCRCRLKLMVYHDEWGAPRPRKLVQLREDLTASSRALSPAGGDTTLMPHNRTSTTIQSHQHGRRRRRPDYGEVATIASGIEMHISSSENQAAQVANAKTKHKHKRHKKHKKHKHSSTIVKNGADGQIRNNNKIISASDEINLAIRLKTYDKAKSQSEENKELNFPMKTKTRHRKKRERLGKKHGMRNNYQPETKIEEANLSYQAGR